MFKRRVLIAAFAAVAVALTPQASWGAEELSLPVVESSGTSGADAGSILQPNGPNTLQAEGAQTSGLTAPADSGLQAVGTTDNQGVNEFLNGELSGSVQDGGAGTQASADDAPVLLTAFLPLVVLLGVFGAMLYTLTRRPARRLAPASVPSLPTPPVREDDAPSRASTQTTKPSKSKAKRKRGKR